LKQARIHPRIIALRRSVSEIEAADENPIQKQRNNGNGFYKVFPCFRKQLVKGSEIIIGKNGSCVPGKNFMEGCLIQNTHLLREAFRHGQARNQIIPAIVLQEGQPTVGNVEFSFQLPKNRFQQFRGSVSQIQHQLNL